MSNKKCYCYNCMNEKAENASCPICENDGTEMDILPFRLKPGTRLAGRYIVGRVLGQGGFGITYIGIDEKLEMRVAIKEYYPSAQATRNNEITDIVTIINEEYDDIFEKGKKSFLAEARVLAGFNDLEGVVDVRDIFEENGTAYIVMEYLEGENLSQVLSKKHFSPEEIIRLFIPVMKSLERIHKKNVIHRDISPDNLILLESGNIKLMDFGAARVIDTTDAHSTSVVLKAGYAPEEQYRRRGKMGPWTDVYAICATMYKCITGVIPDDALERLYQDEMKWPSELGISINPDFEAALKKGMEIIAADRFEDVAKLRMAIEGHGIESSEPVKNSDDENITDNLLKVTKAGLSGFKISKKIAIAILSAVIVISLIAIIGRLNTEHSSTISGDTVSDAKKHTLAYDESKYVHISLQPLEILTVKKFSDAANRIRERLDIIMPDGGYNFEIKGNGIEADIPLDYYRDGDGPILRCFAVPGEIAIAHLEEGDDEPSEKILLNAGDVVSSEVVMGEIPQLDAEAIDGTKGQYHYVKLKLADPVIEKYGDVLNKWGKNIELLVYRSDDEGGVISRSRINMRPLEEAGCFAVYQAIKERHDESDREEYCKLAVHEYMHAATYVYFNINTSEGNIGWERDEADFGQLQIAPENLDIETVTLEFSMKGKLGSGTLEDCELAFKSRLDALGMQYAFGYKNLVDDGEEVHKIFVRTGYDRMGMRIAKMLTLEKPSFSLYDSKGTAFMCGLPEFDENEDGELSIVLKYDKDEFAEDANGRYAPRPADIVKQARENGDEYFYLGFDEDMGVPFFRGDVPDSVNGEIAFNYLMVMGMPLDEQSRWCYDFCREVCAGRVMPKEFKLEGVQKDYVTNPQQRYQEYWADTNDEKAVYDVRAAIKNDFPYADVGADRDGSRIIIKLHLKEDFAAEVYKCAAALAKCWDTENIGDRYVYIEATGDEGLGFYMSLYANYRSVYESKDSFSNSRLGFRYDVRNYNGKYKSEKEELEKMLEEQTEYDLTSFWTL